AASLLAVPHSHPALHSFPTRRSSDLPMAPMVMGGGMALAAGGGLTVFQGGPAATTGRPQFSVAGTLSPEVQAQMAAMQKQQEERSEEHTSELQSHLNLVCRLLLEKKK